PEVAAGPKANVLAGGGFAIGSKPRFLSTHLRSTLMARSPRPPHGTVIGHATADRKMTQGQVTDEGHHTVTALLPKSWFDMVSAAICQDIRPGDPPFL